MDKIIYQDANEEFMKAVSRNGEAMSTIIDCERGAKCAASDLIKRSTLEEHRPKEDGHCLVHLIAMGNSDMYGFNRNGDYFAGDVLEKRAHTFVKYGHVFREHRNKDPKKAIGTIKYAAYDPKGMQRVELLVDIDKKKAGPEFEKAANGDALNWSMSCRVPNDRCSCCGNEAKSVSRYCKHLRDHMGQWDPEFDKYAFAYNDVPTFFDISHVRLPADRIARHLEYMFPESASEMKKAASAEGGGLVIPSAIAAEAEGVRLGAGYGIDEQRMIAELADAEEYASDPSNAGSMFMDKRANMMFGSFPFSLTEPFTPDELSVVRSVSTGTLMRELANRFCMMSFPGFCQYVSGDPGIMGHPVARQAACELPRVFKRIRIRIVMPQPCETHTDDFRMASSFMAGQDPMRDKVQNIMDDMEEKFSMQAPAIGRRVIVHVAKGRDTDKAGKMLKEAAAFNYVERARGLADAYGEYQIRALCDMRDLHGDDAVTPEMIDATVGANLVRVYGA